MSRLAANRVRYRDAGVGWLTIVATARSLTQLREDVKLFGDTVIARDPDR